MNVTVFADALEQLDSFHDYYETSSELSSLASLAQSAAGNVAQQQSYVDAKKKLFRTLLNDVGTYLFDYQVALIKEAGLSLLIPTHMAQRLKQIVSDNESTLAVLSAEVNKLKEEVDSKLNAISTLRQSLKTLNIETDFLQEGDSAIIIQLASSSLASTPKKFAGTLEKIISVVQKVVNDASGVPQELELRALSNPTPTVILTTAVAGVFAFSKALKMLAEAFKTFQEGRQIGIGIKNSKSLSAALQQQIKQAEKARKDVLDAAFKEQIEQVAKNLYKGKQANGHLGLSKKLKELVGYIHDGARFDVVAIPYDNDNLESENDNEEDAALLKNKQSILEAIKDNSGLASQLNKLLEDEDIVQLLTLDDSED